MDTEEQGRERMSEASCPYRSALDGTERDSPGRLVSHLKTGGAQALGGSNPSPSAHRPPVIANENINVSEFPELAPRLPPIQSAADAVRAASQRMRPNSGGGATSAPGARVLP
jgi:hypothetical protein